MTSIAFIQDTGSHEGNEIFTGVFGTVRENIFHIDESLRQISLFKLKPENLHKTMMAQGVDLTKDVLEIDVDESAVDALRATMIAALMPRWLAVYDCQMSEFMGQDHDSGKKGSEILTNKAQVQRVVNKAIFDTRLLPSTVQFSRFFTNADTTQSWVNNAGPTDRAPDAVYVRATALASLARPLAGSCLEAEGGDAAVGWTASQNLMDPQEFEGFCETVVETYSSLPGVGYASGELATWLNVYGNAAQTLAVTNLIARLPSCLTSRMCLNDRSKIAGVLFHADVCQWANKEQLVYALAESKSYVNFHVHGLDQELSAQGPQA